MNIKYSCMVFTVDGPMAKIDGEWYTVAEEQGVVTGVHFKLNALQREKYDLLNAGELAKNWINIP